MDDTRARKLALLAEFEREIAPQKLQLEALLPNLWKSCYPDSQPPATGFAGGGKAGGKRVPAGGSGPDPKRPRTEEMERRMEPMYKECQKIMKKLFNMQSSNWFRRPVDPVKDGCPNYLHFVKQPRDLGTIKTKLQARAYRSPMEFKTDVDLVWSNCALYNQEGTPARMDGDKCKAAFDRSWRDTGIEAQLQQIQDEVDCVAAPLHERVGALNNQLVRAVEQLPVSSHPEGSSRGDMSFGDKRRLSMRLASLPADLYHGVFDLLSADPCTSAAADADVEVEVDDLRADTLWKLHDFVLNPSSKPSSQPTSQPARSEQPAGGTAEQQTFGRGQNGTASVHTSGAGSDSDLGEHSPNELKASTMDDPQQGASGLVRDGRDVRNAVDVSATNPKEQSQFIKDRATEHKADVNVNAANWESLASAPPSAGAGASDAQPEPDDVWCSFQSVAEQKQQREEQKQQEGELEEKRRREEQERKETEEEEARQRKLQEEEERQEEEVKKEREEQLKNDVDEIKAKAGTANLPQQSDVLTAPAAEGSLAAVGLELAGDNEDMNFEDV